MWPGTNLLPSYQVIVATRRCYFKYLHWNISASLSGCLWLVFWYAHMTQMYLWFKGVSLLWSFIISAWTLINAEQVITCSISSYLQRCKCILVLQSCLPARAEPHVDASARAWPCPLGTGVPGCQHLLESFSTCSCYFLVPHGVFPDLCCFSCSEQVAANP